jgi:plasmid stabilization system protein ParE
VARRVRWTTPAWEDLAEAANHIARDSKYYAAAFVLEASERAASLNRFADRGREVPEYGDPAVDPSLGRALAAQPRPLYAWSNRISEVESMDADDSTEWAVSGVLHEP